MRITLAVEKAKKEIRDTTELICNKYGIPACIAEGILSELLLEKKTESLSKTIEEAEEIQQIFEKENADLKEKLTKAVTKKKKPRKGNNIPNEEGGPDGTDTVNN